MPLIMSTTILEHCHSIDEMSYTGMTPANKQAIKRLCAACALVALFIISEIIGDFNLLKVDLAKKKKINKYIPWL